MDKFNDKILFYFLIVPSPEQGTSHNTLSNYYTLGYFVQSLDVRTAQVAFNLRTWNASINALFLLMSFANNNDSFPPIILSNIYFVFEPGAYFIFIELQ